MTKVFCAALIVGLIAGSPQAFAWGSKGHRMVSRLAIESLPPDIPDFLRDIQTAKTISEVAEEPDRLRGAGASHDRNNDPAHFINLNDDFRATGGVVIDPLPATREDFDTALRNVGSNQYRTGFLPYAIIDGWQQVQKDFVYWRIAERMERSAVTKVERTRFARDRRLREMLVIRDIGYWSHFVADAAQPMHVSIHYDGWGDHPNPRGYRTAKGFHAAFETTFVSRYVDASMVRRQVPPFRDCSCSIESRTITYLRASHTQLPRLYELEKSGAFSPTPAGRDFAERRLAAAVAELRDLIVSAWRESETADTPPASAPDLFSDKAE